MIDGETEMQVTIDTEALAGVIGAVCGAAGAAIALMIRMARPVRRHMDRFRLFLEDWEGEPPRYDGAVPERPGMMKRVAAIEARQVQHEHAHQLAAGALANGSSNSENGSMAA